jgi:hypothetical protein
MSAIDSYPNAWRERVEDELERHRELGKVAHAAPATEADWVELYRVEPRAIYAAWFAITGRHARRRS